MGGGMRSRPRRPPALASTCSRRCAGGIAALLAHQPAQAAESLRAVWQHTRREGVDEPGVFPVAPDLLEALVGLGEPDKALAVTRRLRAGRRPAASLDSRRRSAAALSCSSPPRATTTTQRRRWRRRPPTTVRSACASTLPDRSSASAARSGGQRSGPRPAARWSSPRPRSTRCSSGWTERARSELARVGARRPPAAGELTPTESRVVEQAAAGLSNKQIAKSLYVSVHTIEVHLSHAYAKLGVGSRAQLAGRLSDRT